MHGLDWFGGGWLTMIFWWLLIIVGIIFLVKWISDQKSQARNEDSALQILKKRYASGEISKEEFEEKKKDLV